MMGFHNVKERDADDWAKDPRFKFLGIKRPPLSRLGIIIARWDGGLKEGPSDL